MKDEIVRIKAGEDTNELRANIKRIFRQNKTFFNKYFKITDLELNTKLFPEEKTRTYTTIRNMSLKAEKIILKLLRTTPVDYDTARRVVKVKYTLPLLLKKRRDVKTGEESYWYEPSILQLDYDQRRRFEQAILHKKFAEDRTQDIEEIDTLDAQHKTIKSVNEK